MISSDLPVADRDDSDADRLLTQKVFLEGPAGAGKTTYAVRHLLRLLERGAQPDRILVLVPQVTLGRPYQLALHNSPFAGGMTNIYTVAGLARKAVETFWPLIAGPMGFAEPGREPTFLNVETAQYFMARLAAPLINERRFEAVNIAPPRVISQVLDNLNRAAIMRFPLDEVAGRLISAWGDRRTSHVSAYQSAADLARQFRDHCLQHNLLDYSLIMEAFAGYLLPEPSFRDYLHGQLDFLIADNIEEDNPTSHDFIAWLLPALHGALILYDTDGGFRTFLGADPDYAFNVRDLCEEHITLNRSHIMPPAVGALDSAFNRIIGPAFRAPEPSEEDVTPQQAFEYTFHRYYPQMIEWASDKIVELVQNGVPLQEIVVVAPTLSDSLRFTLTYQIETKGRALGLNIPTLSHRPSRALRDEAVTRAVLTLATLAHPEWIDDLNVQRPPVDDVADAFSLVIADLDPVRARLLTDIVYRSNARSAEPPSLSTFARIGPDMQKRISYLAGQRYENLRFWLESYRAQLEHEGSVPLDHFLRRLFGEVISQPGYGFHNDLEAGRIVAQLIQSAAAFRTSLYPGADQDWLAAGREYVGLINQRLLPALFAQSWQDDDTEAVFLAPVSTFLLRGRFVDYQFWLDVGSNSWSARLEQPLTHPYVLKRDHPADQMWTDEMEMEAQQTALYRSVVGLTRRCRKQIYMGIADLGESGFEQRGVLLRVLQQVLRGNVDEADGGVPDHGTDGSVNGSIDGSIDGTGSDNGRQESAGTR